MSERMSTSTDRTSTDRIDHQEADHLAELRRALQSRPRTIPPRWLYDDRGSELFDEITRLVEYYPTEAEREILADLRGTARLLVGEEEFLTPFGTEAGWDPPPDD